MAKYINLEELMKFPIRQNHYDKKHGSKDFIYGIETVLEYAENLPAADVAPVVHGHWSETDDDGEYTCSHCGWVGRITCLGKDKIGSSDIDYCPYCSTKMDEVSE